MICASRVGCQFNYSYGEDYVYANKRRQGGREERNSDLLIDRDAGMGGDVDMAVEGEESDQDEQGTGQQCRQAGSLQPGIGVLCSEPVILCRQRSETDLNRSRKILFYQ